MFMFNCEELIHFLVRNKIFINPFDKKIRDKNVNFFVEIRM